MFSDTCGDHPGTLPFGFFGEQVAHNRSIRVIEVTDGLIDEDEVEGLAQSPDERHSLLLSERHELQGRVGLVADTEHVEPLHDGLFLLVTRQFVLDQYVLHRGEFGKEPQFLPQ